MSTPVAFRPLSYRSACGRLDLYARVYDGDGPALLLMHGLTRNSADFEPLAARLADRYRLIVPDQRGRGLSDYDSDAGNYRPDVYAADMVALLDRLRVERAGLLGTSMGGLIAMIMAAMQPDRVQAVVLNDVGPQIEPDGLARIQAYVGPSLPVKSWEEAAERCAAINGVAFPDFGADDWLTFARRACVEVDGGAVRFAYDPAIAVAPEGVVSLAPPDLWPLWDMLTNLPVLVVRGALSDLLSARTVTEMASRHAGPFAAVEVAGRGHAPILEEPAALAAIEPFLAQHAV